VGLAARRRGILHLLISISAGSGTKKGGRKRQKVTEGEEGRETRCDLSNVEGQA